MADSLLKLSKLISEYSTQLIQRTERLGLKLPEIEDAYTEQSEAYMKDAQCAEAVTILAAAALQLVAQISPAKQTTMSHFSGHFKSSSVRVAIECHIPEILREAGNKGLHADEIAAICEVDAKKLARHLRFLSIYHIFREVSPNVFANTRLSEVLDSGKSVALLKRDRSAKHDDTEGFCAIAEHVTFDVQRSAVYSYEQMKNGATDQTGFQVAYNQSLTYYPWVESPGNEYRLRRFGTVMRGFANLQPPDAVRGAYAWDTLPNGSRIVDVGGGVGTIAMQVAKLNPKLKVIVQDTQGVVDYGRRYCGEVFPEALKSGLMEYQIHDFFSPQPVKNATMFILKNIVHNWPEDKAVQILSRLREAATPNTKLMIIGTLIGYSCRQEGSNSSIIYKEAPEPLLPHYGGANEVGYATDMTMMAIFNAQEYTIGDLNSMFEKSGWKISSVQKSDPPHNFFDPVIAIPVERPQRQDRTSHQFSHL